MKVLRSTFFIFSLLIITIVSASSEESGVVTLNSLIEEAKENNPAIQAAYSSWKAAEYKTIQEKSLPDPTGSYTYFGENVETRVGPQEYKYAISQKIPFPGKLSLKGRAQAKYAEMIKEQYEAVEREVIRNVKFIFYDLFWVDRAIQITEEEKAILESLEQVAQRRYETGWSPQQDVIKAQVEISRLIDKLYMLKQNRKSLIAKLNSILNRKEGSDLAKVENVELIEFSYNLDELYEIAKVSRQELLEANLNVERAEYEKSLAKLDYFPDFTFGFEYINVEGGHTTSPLDGQDAWAGKVSINIPIWFHKLGAQLKEKKAQLDASKKIYQNVKNSVNYEIEDLYYKIGTYRDIVLLYETALIPQTEQSFQAAKTGYETGRVDFLNWLDAERMLLQTRLAYYKATVDYQKTFAFLERVVGKGLQQQLVAKIEN